MPRKEISWEDLADVFSVSPIPRPAGARPPATRPEGGSSAGVEPRGAAREEVEGLYIISVAARMLNVHPQTLRKYERLGLISPFRTDGMLRLYSRVDIVRIRFIRHLEENLGLNLAGVYMALDLLARLGSLRERLVVEHELEDLRSTIEEELANLFDLLGLLPDSEGRWSNWMEDHA